LLDLVAEKVESKEKIRISTLHAAAPEEARVLADKVTDRIKPIEHISAVVGPAIGTHVGPGTVGIAYCTGI
jgi:fatty acid-binding protein DegV